MTTPAYIRDHDDPLDLSRFLRGQEKNYDTALAELRSGRKRSHWMWYIFPQVDGLGYTDTAKYYAVKSVEEARQYLAHPVLGTRLLECSEAVLAAQGRAVEDIFGYPDDLKLRSCMTLFAYVAEPDSVFIRVIDRYFGGEQDSRTLRILEEFGQRKN